MNQTHWSDKLVKLGACDESVAWAKKQPSYSLAWRKCHRPEWLFWLAGRANVSQESIVLAACACARTVLHLIPEGEDRPRLAIEAAEAWARDPSSDPDKVKLNRAREEAWAAYHGLYYPAAGSAAAAVTAAAPARAQEHADIAAVTAAEAAATATIGFARYSEQWYVAYNKALAIAKKNLCNVVRLNIERPKL